MLRNSDYHMEEKIPILVIIIISLLLVALWPLAVVWSVNTLFETNIEYNLKTWAAIVVLFSVLKVASTKIEKRVQG